MNTHYRRRPRIDAPGRNFLPAALAWFLGFAGITAGTALPAVFLRPLAAADKPKGKNAKESEADPAFTAQKAKYEEEKEKEAFERLDSIIAFGEVVSDKTVPFLIEILDKETNPAIRGAILKALGKQATLEAVQVVVQKGIPMLAGDANFFYIGDALRNPFDPKVEKWLVKNALTPAVRKDPESLRTVIDVIAGLKDASRFEVLARELSPKSAPGDLQVAILSAFRDHKPKNAASEGFRMLAHPELDVQVAALQVLLAVEAKTYNAHYFKLLKSKEWQVRSLAVELLSLSRDAKQVKQLTPLLADADDHVRLAAIEAMVNIATKDVLEPFIKALGQNRGRILDDLASGLFRLTGEDLGANAAQWESWWATNKDRADIRKRDREEFQELRNRSLESGRTGLLTYHGIPVLSEKVAFIIDTSESMLESYGDDPAASKKPAGGEKKQLGPRAAPRADEEKKPEPQPPGKPPKKPEGERGKPAPGKPPAKPPRKPVVAGDSKMAVARKEFIKVLQNLKDGILINVIRFNTFVQPWRPTSVNLDKTVSAEITAFVQEGQPEGLTNIFGALEAAFQDEKIDTIYLLTDGAPTHGRFTQTEDILKAIRSLNQIRRVKVNTIGFGLQAEERKLLELLAEQNYGVFISR